MVMKRKIEGFEDLEIWQLSHKLSLDVYRITKNYPKDELYGLTSQLRRASTSVPANIVEGYYRNTTKELVQFLYHARGSTGEVIHFLVLSKDLKYITELKYNNLRAEYEILIRKITAMINSLKRRK